MNQARGIYQPLAEKVPLYDLADDEIDEERSRVPLLIVIALVVLAAFAGVVWLAYNQGVARGRAGTSIVIEAPNGPVRVAPTDAGSPTPYTGLKVYSQPIPPDQEAQSSTLAPQVRAPVTTEAPPARLVPAAPPPRVASQAPAAPPITAAPPALRTVPPAAAPQAPRPVQVAAPPAPTAPPPGAPAPLPARPPATANNAAVSGAAVLQIGAFENEAAANGAWTRFRSRYDSAGTLSPDIQKVDLGAKGIWYRLRAGPFADRTAAVDACVKLKAAGATCFVTPP